MRPLLLDDALPHGLARELRARGREAWAVGEHGLAGAGDAAVMAAAARLGAVLVTTCTSMPAGGVPVAVVTARPGAPRRDAVHRHAHAMAAQRPGSSRRYR